MTFEDLHAEALKEAIHELWLAEAERRDLEMEQGTIHGVPGDEVLERLRSRHP